MKLRNVTSGHSLARKLMLKVARVMFGAELPDVLRVAFYRPNFFGKPIVALENAVLRGQSDWSVGERELFAAFVSVKNKCRFCMDAHTAVAGRVLGHEVVDAIMADLPTAPIRAPARAMLVFLDKLTITPEDVTADDIRALRTEGIRDDAIVDGIYICMIFCVMNRVADAFGYEIMTPKQIEQTGKFLLRYGY